ncbi:MAG TPA: DUF2237 domain-containing protein [Abditibacterium sp.]|jgi:hypothetical protein
MARSTLNVLGEPLQNCSMQPMTGFYRNGCCDTGEGDMGLHLVCAVMTDEFLQFSKRRGNDLITPLLVYGFPGLKAGDRWCLCVSRWKEAFEAGVAPRVVLDATHLSALEWVSLDDLKAHAFV